MKLNKLRTVLTAVTVAAVAGVVALAIPANGAGTADNRFITVTGVGTISVVPDAVRFNATVSALWFNKRRSAINCIKICSSCSRSFAQGMQELQQRIFVQQTSRSTLNTTGHKRPAQRSLATVHHNHLMFLVRTASKAGTIIEAVVTAGGDSVQLGGVIPTTLNPSAATEDARAAAVANARQRLLLMQSFLEHQSERCCHLKSNLHLCTHHHFQWQRLQRQIQLFRSI
jgi:uncharacterized protein